MIGQYGIQNPYFMYQGTCGLSLPTNEEGQAIKLAESAVILDVCETPDQSGTRFCSAEY